MFDREASVRPRGGDILQANLITKSQRSRQQILEEVADRGSVAIFEPLQSRGTPLGWRPLRVVETATCLHPSNKSPSEYRDRMDMVHCLIEEV
jgi:hypothetical protein